MVEIVEVLQRCKQCGTATAVLVEDTYISLDGKVCHAMWRDDPEHTRNDCDRMVTLEREQWPTLW